MHSGHGVDTGGIQLADKIVDEVRVDRSGEGGLAVVGLERFQYVFGSLTKSSTNVVLALVRADHR